MNILHKTLPSHMWHKQTREVDGATLDDYFTSDGNRYMFDTTLSSNDGWEQFDTDQDAWYFGVWVNNSKGMTVTYCEGDVMIKHGIPDMKKEYDDLCECYGKAPPFATAYDEDGTVTKYYSR